MTDPMVQLIREYRLIPPGSAVLCAVSGGADSIYLLHRLWRLRRELNEHGYRYYGAAQVDRLQDVL